MPKRQPQPEGAKRSLIKRQRDIHPLCVVGIGASAGGLEASRKLLESLPDAPGLAVATAR